jgi:hypothetical protein
MPDDSSTPSKLPTDEPDKLDLSNPAHLTQQALGKYINSCIEYWGGCPEIKYEPWEDDELYQCSRDNFIGWTEDIFKLVYTNDLKRLRNHLRDWGVFIPKNKKNLAKNLARFIAGDVIDDPEWDWTDEDIKKQAISGRLCSHRLQYRYSNLEPVGDKPRTEAPRSLTFRKYTSWHLTAL